MNRAARVWRWLKMTLVIIAVAYLLFGIATAIWLVHGIGEGLRQIPD